ncbi:type III secretion protein [Rhodobacteraceae bacterium 2CG4]|uniref:Type III secretion protein n=1 Tax=Halovulum marinum TaxID=2662447 RepID=A0A6L5Z5F2_9RHOB|nr:flagellar biosynthetic protein FliR [Halovulum marinum]MSU91806.1 type III secretion protein [Halovulum marinum]
MFDLLQALLDQFETRLLATALVFVRLGAAVGLMPGFGEIFLPMRVKLAAVLALTAVVAPAVDTGGVPAAVDLPRFAALVLTETGIGLLIGLAARLLVHALQLAGSIAGQATALAQMAGPGLAPDPMPAMSNGLTMAGLALAMAAGLHVKIAAGVIASYGVLGIGAALPGADVGAWGLRHAVAGFALGFTLAAPFVIAALLYNLALGAINRAMPQLMVAFIGAPVITGGTLALFLLAAPVMLGVWSGRLDAVLANPFTSGLPR